MSRDFLKRLEKVEQRMNPPDETPKVRFRILFIRPDGTVAGKRIIEPGKPDVIIQEDDDD
jgi:hypothetical protein